MLTQKFEKKPRAVACPDTRSTRPQFKNIPECRTTAKKLGFVDSLLVVRNGYLISENYFQESWTASDSSNGMKGDYDAIEESGYGFLWWIVKIGGYWTQCPRNTHPPVSNRTLWRAQRCKSQ
jgi:hypothetical protein